MRQTINMLRRISTKAKKNNPNMISINKAVLYVQAVTALKIGLYKSYMQGVYEERISHKWFWR